MSHKKHLERGGANPEPPAPGREPAAPDDLPADALGEDRPDMQGKLEQDLVGELDKLRGEVEQTKDHALRCQAELENYRKRISREMEEERRYANLRLLRDLLPVLDNIELAVGAAEKLTDPASLLQGFKLVAKQLEGVLERYHCTKIEALNRPFDPALHEAIGQQPSAVCPANTVLVVARNGYMLRPRVVRPSQVIVSTAAPLEPPADGPDGQVRS